jgi:hypothetical protein
MVFLFSELARNLIEAEKLYAEISGVNLNDH